LEEESLIRYEDVRGGKIQELRAELRDLPEGKGLFGRMGPLNREGKKAHGLRRRSATRGVISRGGGATGHPR